jgi:low affinity Fe/Cu permease
MTVTEDTTERPTPRPTLARSSGPGTTTQAMQDAVKRPTTFDRFADWVSEAMGRPLNISFWFIFVVVWFCVFAFGGPKLDTGSWMPAWFTSLGFNLPLNLITTLAELFIGFLVATAANRAQNALTELLDKIDLQEEQIETTETNIVTLVKENTDLTSEIHTLTTEIRTLTMQVLKNATLIAETHQQVAALTAQAGLDVGGSPPDTSPPATTS